MSTLTAPDAYSFEMPGPGPGYRPVPTIRFEVPADWLATEFPGCLVGFVAPGEGTWTNVLIRHERVAPDLTLDQVAADYLRGFPDDEPDNVFVEHLLLDFAVPHYFCHMQLPGEETGTKVTRFDSWFFDPGEHLCRDLFHVTWISPLLNDRTVQQSCFHFLDSIQF